MIVTRAATNAAELITPLAALGAEVIEAAATRIEPLERSHISAALGNLSMYDWVLFTSRNAVHIAWTALHDMGRGAQQLAACRVAAVGPTTAGALAALGIRVDAMPTHFVAESLLETLRARSDVRGTRVLYLAAEGARDVLPQGLRALGATVDVMPLYRSLPNDEGFVPLRERLLHGDVELVTFTAGSSARAFVRAVGADAAAGVRIVTMGPATSAVVRELGLTVCAEARPSTLEGLVQAVVAACT